MPFIIDQPIRSEHSLRGSEHHRARQVGPRQMFKEIVLLNFVYCRAAVVSRSENRSADCGVMKSWHCVRLQAVRLGYIGWGHLRRYEGRLVNPSMLAKRA